MEENIIKPIKEAWQMPFSEFQKLDESERHTETAPSLMNPFQYYKVLFDDIKTEKRRLYVTKGYSDKKRKRDDEKWNNTLTQHRYAGKESFQKTEGSEKAVIDAEKKLGKFLAETIFTEKELKTTDYYDWDLKEIHRRIISKALREDKPVPEDILAIYTEPAETEKETWQMTFEEYKRMFLNEFPYFPKGDDDIMEIRSRDVKKAIEHGKRVPESVLNDYPELKAIQVPDEIYALQKFKKGDVVKFKETGTIVTITEAHKNPYYDTENKKWYQLNWYYSFAGDKGGKNMVHIEEQFELCEGCQPDDPKAMKKQKPEKQMKAEPEEIQEKSDTMKKTTMYYKINHHQLEKYVEFLKELKKYTDEVKVFAAGLGEDYLIVKGDYDKNAAMHPSISTTDFDDIVVDAVHNGLISSKKRLSSRPSPEQRWVGKWMDIDDRINRIESALKQIKEEDEAEKQEKEEKPEKPAETDSFQKKLNSLNLALKYAKTEESKENIKKLLKGLELSQKYAKKPVVDTTNIFSVGDLIPSQDNILEITGFANNLYQHRDWNDGKTMVLGSGNTSQERLISFLKQKSSQDTIRIAIESKLWIDEQEIANNIINSYKKANIELPEILKKYSETFNKKFLTELAGVKIYSVNGDHYRKVNTQFTMGGHNTVGGDYKNIPDGEIWIDENLVSKELDLKATVLHELLEYRLMNEKKMSYDKAHEIAEEKEKYLRNQEINLSWLELENAVKSHFQEYDKKPAKKAEKTETKKLADGGYISAEEESQIAEKYDEQIRDKQGLIRSLKAARSKKLAELQGRVGLFGDTKQTENALFETEICATNECFYNALKPMVDKIAKIQSEIDMLEKEKRAEIIDAKAQMSLAFKNGGGVNINKYLNKHDMEKCLVTRAGYNTTYKYVSENPEVIKTGTPVEYQGERHYIQEASDKSLRLVGYGDWIHISEVKFQDQFYRGGNIHTKTNEEMVFKAAKGKDIELSYGDVYRIIKNIFKRLPLLEELTEEVISEEIDFYVLAPVELAGGGGVGTDELVAVYLPSSFFDHLENYKGKVLGTYHDPYAKPRLQYVIDILPYSEYKAIMSEEKNKYTDSGIPRNSWVSARPFKYVEEFGFNKYEEEYTDGGRVKNLDKVKEDIGEKIYNHIASLDKEKLEKMLENLQQEQGYEYQQAGLSPRYYKLKNEEWFILYRLERTNEFDYPLPFADGGGVGEMVTLYKFFGATLSGQSMYPPYPRLPMKWTTDKQKVIDLYDKANISDFNADELEEVFDVDNVLFFEILKTEIPISLWNKIKESDNTSDDEHIENYSNWNYDHVKERAIYFDGKPVPKKELNELYADGGGIEQSGSKYQVVKSKHTKTGADIWIVKMLDRVDSSTYKAIESKVKQHGGGWSRFVKGFLFKTEPNTDILDNIFGIMEAASEQNASIPQSKRGLITFDESQKYQTVNRGVLRKEWEAGKMMVARYKNFDGMTDSWDYTQDKDLVYIEKGKNEDTDKWLADDFSSSYDHASADFDSQTITVGNYKMKYKPDVAVTVIKKPTGYFSYNYYVDIDKKEVGGKNYFDIPSQTKNLDIPTGTRVRTYHYGKPYCGKIIDKHISTTTVTSYQIFGGTKESRIEHDARYKVLLDNGYTDEPFSFEITEECNDVEQPLLKNGDKIEFADEVWYHIKEEIKYIKGTKSQLAGRKLEKYRIQDKKNIENREKKLYRLMGIFLQWELTAPEFVESVTGESAPEQNERRKLWETKLNIKPDPSAKYTPDIEKLKVEETQTALDNYTIAFNPLIEKYELQGKENNNTVYYMYSDIEHRFGVRLEITEKGIKTSLILVKADKIEENMFTEIPDVEKYLDTVKEKYHDFWIESLPDLKNKVKLPFPITRGAEFIGLYEVQRKGLLFLDGVLGDAGTKTSVVLILGENGMNDASFVEIYKSETPYHEANDFVRTVKFYDHAGVMKLKTNFSYWLPNWGFGGLQNYFWGLGWTKWAADAEPKEKKVKAKEVKAEEPAIEPEVKEQPEANIISEEISTPNQSEADLFDIAEEMGEEAFKNGVERTPIKCKKFREFFIENPAVPMGETKYYNAWYKGWDKSNLKAPVTEKGKLILESDVWKLIEFLNKEDDPKKKAEVWNKCIYDEEGAGIIMACRSRNINDQDISLWQLAVKYGKPLIEVVTEGDESKVRFNGNDLLIAINKYAKDKGIEVVKPVEEPEVKEMLQNATLISAEKWQENVPVHIAKSKEYQDLYKLYESQQISPEDFKQGVNKLIDVDVEKKMRKLHNGDWVKDKDGIEYQVDAEHPYNERFGDFEVVIINPKKDWHKIIEQEGNLTLIQKPIEERQKAETIKAKEPEEKTGKLKLSDIPDIVKKIMPVHQQKAIVGSEEHFDIIKDIEKQASKVPARGGMNYDSIVRLHYFYGGSDWFITEWHKKDGIFYGYAILNADYVFSEFGSMYVSDMTENGRIELDFFWQEKTVQEALEHTAPSYFGKGKPEDKSKPSKEESQKMRKDFLDNLTPDDGWKKFEADGRWYRNFSFDKSQLSKERMITDMGIKERLTEREDGGVDAIISVKEEKDFIPINKLYNEEFKVKKETELPKLSKDHIEFLKEILKLVEEGKAILTSSANEFTERGLPHINSVKGADHMGYGLFKAKSSTGQDVFFDGGKEMIRLSGGSYSQLTGDVAHAMFKDGTIGYPFEKVKEIIKGVLKEEMPDGEKQVKKIEAGAKIYLKEIQIKWAEGTDTERLRNKIFTSFTELQKDISPLFEKGGGYNKVKMLFTFEDSGYILDRIDVGENEGDFNPETQNIQDYLKGVQAQGMDVMYETELKKDVGQYLFEFRESTEKPKEEKPVYKEVVAEKDQPLLSFEEYKELEIANNKAMDIKKVPEEKYLQKTYKKYEKEWKVLNNKRDKLTIENEVMKLIDALNKAIDSEKRAELWNDGIIDEDDNLYVASRHRVVKGTGKTLWQLGLDSGLNLVRSGDESELSFSGTDLLRAIKKYASAYDMEVVIEETKPEPEKPAPVEPEKEKAPEKVELTKQEVEKLLKGLETQYKYKPTDELKKRIRGYQIILKHQK